ncbi:hypothetical protein PR202_ga29241 [Eleusine coracana subsp. coracana]|uniref:Uncharacterized protein n=1 Tax=Eleusine coracana subsp. coracana TaxID=191504 RepID=A0AAV5DLL8_ELECO|nr:hypothetical protein PR202_ga29241 [Eleusine coracana subsp. coracana]
MEQEAAASVSSLRSLSTETRRFLFRSCFEKPRRRAAAAARAEPAAAASGRAEESSLRAGRSRAGLPSRAGRGRWARRGGRGAGEEDRWEGEEGEETGERRG